MVSQALRGVSYLFVIILIISPAIYPAQAAPGLPRHKHLSSSLASPPGLILARHTHEGAIPRAEVVQLFNVIIQHFSEFGVAKETQLVITDSLTPNAYARNQREVVLTQALLERVPDASELAFIIAHECAHLALGHGVDGGVDAELAADSLALKVVTALDFNPCSSSSVLKRLGSPYQLALVSVQPRLTALHDKTFNKCG